MVYLKDASKSRRFTKRNGRTTRNLAEFDQIAERRVDDIESSNRPSKRKHKCVVSYVLVDEDRVSISVHCNEAGRPRRVLVRLLLQLHPLCLSWRCSSRTSVKAASFWALLSQPGLKVRMFLSNIPRKSPMQKPFLAGVLIATPCMGDNDGTLMTREASLDGISSRLQLRRL